MNHQQQELDGQPRPKVYQRKSFTANQSPLMIISLENCNIIGMMMIGLGVVPRSRLATSSSRVSICSSVGADAFPGDERAGELGHAAEDESDGEGCAARGEVVRGSILVRDMECAVC